MEKRMISFSPPDISELEIAEVAEALRSGWITTGPRTKLLESPDALNTKTFKTTIYSGVHRLHPIYCVSGRRKIR